MPDIRQRPAPCENILSRNARAAVIAVVDGTKAYAVKGEHALHITLYRGYTKVPPFHNQSDAMEIERYEVREDVKRNIASLLRTL